MRIEKFDPKFAVLTSVILAPFKKLSDKELKDTLDIIPKQKNVACEGGAIVICGVFFKVLGTKPHFQGIIDDTTNVVLSSSPVLKIDKLAHENISSITIPPSIPQASTYLSSLIQMPYNNILSNFTSPPVPIEEIQEHQKSIKLCVARLAHPVWFADRKNRHLFSPDYFQEQIQKRTVFCSTNSPPQIVDDKIKDGEYFQHDTIHNIGGVTVNTLKALGIFDESLVALKGPNGIRILRLVSLNSPSKELLTVMNPVTKDAIPKIRPIHIFKKLDTKRASVQWQDNTVYLPPYVSFNMGIYAHQFTDVSLQFVPLSPEMLPVVARSAKISPIIAPHTPQASLSDFALHEYFKVPRLVHKDDIIAVPIPASNTLAKILDKQQELPFPPVNGQKYSTTAFCAYCSRMLHFKVVELKDSEAGPKPYGFISRDETELTLVSPIMSRLPCNGLAFASESSVFERVHQGCPSETMSFLPLPGAIENTQRLETVFRLIECPYLEQQKQKHSTLYDDSASHGNEDKESRTSKSISHHEAFVDGPSTHDEDEDEEDMIDDDDDDEIVEDPDFDRASRLNSRASFDGNGPCPCKIHERRKNQGKKKEPMYNHHRMLSRVSESDDGYRSYHDGIELSPLQETVTDEMEHLNDTKGSKREDNFLSRLFKPAIDVFSPKLDSDDETTDSDDEDDQEDDDNEEDGVLGELDKFSLDGALRSKKKLISPEPSREDDTSRLSGLDYVIDKNLPERQPDERSVTSIKEISCFDGSGSGSCGVLKSGPTSAFVSARAQNPELESKFACTPISSGSPLEPLRELPGRSGSASLLKSFETNILETQSVCPQCPNAPTPLSVYTALLVGEKGVGRRHSVRAAACAAGIHVMKIECSALLSSNEEAIEAGLFHVLQSSLKFRPSVLVLEGIDILDRVSLSDGTGRAARKDSIFARAFSDFISMNFPPVHPDLSHDNEHDCRIHSNMTSVTPYKLAIVATTTREEELSPKTRNLFTHVIKYDPPNVDQRLAMLKRLSVSMGLSTDVPLLELAINTASFVWKDLKTVVQMASFYAMSDNLKKPLQARSIGYTVTWAHVSKALKLMQARQAEIVGRPKVPTVHWSDVGGLDDAKRELMKALSTPLMPEGSSKSSLALVRGGILFYGPPGTGKTLLAKAAATELSYNFLSVKGPELINMYVGESERNVREIFRTARLASPCVVFFDELDSLAPRRGGGSDGGGVMERVVAQLLSELDSSARSQSVFVIGATNRPDLIEPALLAPGRFETMIYLGISEDREACKKILKVITDKYLFLSFFLPSPFFSFLFFSFFILLACFQGLTLLLM